MFAAFCCSIYESYDCNKNYTHICPSDSDCVRVIIGVDESGSGRRTVSHFFECETFEHQGSQFDINYTSAERIALTANEKK